MDKVAIFYHDIFDFPLTNEDLIKWKTRKLAISHQPLAISQKNGYYFLKGHETLIPKRIQREKISKRKFEIARKASRIISYIPTVKMVAVTGSLAMMNSGKNSDIDLMIVTKKGTLWTTRLFVYALLLTTRYSLRRPFDSNQMDALCLNIWLDESDMVWSKSDRNVYTGHEIAQIVPLINKNNTYEKFLWKNKWILSYWPNSVRVQSTKYRVQSKNLLSTLYYVLCTVLEPVSYWLQYQYMKSKLTRETVTKTRALFHPQDWGKIVLTRLGVEG